MGKTAHAVVSKCLWNQVFFIKNEFDSEFWLSYLWKMLSNFLIIPLFFANKTKWTITFYDVIASHFQRKQFNLIC